MSNSKFDEDAVFEDDAVYDDDAANDDDDAANDDDDAVIDDDAANDDDAVLGEVTLSVLLKMLLIQGITYCWRCTTNPWKSPRRQVEIILSNNVLV